MKEILPDGGYTINEFKSSTVVPGGWYTLEDVSVKKVNANTCTTADPIYPAPPLPHDFERGHQKSKSTYDKNHNKLTETTFLEAYEYSKVGVFGVITKYYTTMLRLPC